jgi:hypothetical protein
MIFLPKKEWSLALIVPEIEREGFPYPDVGTCPIEAVQERD